MGYFRKCVSQLNKILIQLQAHKEYLKFNIIVGLRPATYWERRRKHKDFYSWKGSAVFLRIIFFSPLISSSLYFFSYMCHNSCDLTFFCICERIFSQLFFFYISNIIITRIKFNQSKHLNSLFSQQFILL